MSVGETVPATERTALIPALAAAVVVGLFQLLISWFVLGNAEVLLRLLPVTISGILTAEAFGLVRAARDEQAAVRVARAGLIAALVALVGFSFITGIATSRGQDPIGQPPQLTEWTLTIVCAFLIFAVGGYIARRQ
jgi:hypothetical protein